MKIDKPICRRHGPGAAFHVAYKNETYGPSFETPAFAKIYGGTSE